MSTKKKKLIRTKNLLVLLYVTTYNILKKYVKNTCGYTYVIIKSIIYCLYFLDLHLPRVVETLFWIIYNRNLLLLISVVIIGFSCYYIFYTFGHPLQFNGYPNWKSCKKYTHIPRKRISVKSFLHNYLYQ